MFEWHWEPGILIGVALQVGAYLACVGPLRGLFSRSAPVPRGQVATFLLGSLVLFIALVSPIATLAEAYLLSAHMVQHLLLTLIAPPLLLIGTPRWLLRPLLRPPLALPIARMLTGPVPAFLLFNAVFALWHVPRYYDLALQNELVHIVEHVTFFAAATLTWWPVFSPLDELPRLPVPAQCLYLFFESLPPTVLGAIITFAATPLYPTYAGAPRAWGISLLDDQQIAGLIMWVPGALVYFSVLTYIFISWLNREEYEQSHDTRPVVR